MKIPLSALALGAFAIGITEFAPMGLLPVIAQDMHVSIPATGMLVSAYALGVMLGAPLITLLLSRSSRRGALTGLMLLFTLGNWWSASSSSYEMLLLSRLLTSLAHGAFFGIGAAVASTLVAADKKASAVASMFMGLTIANIGGVPAATWLGHALGWRSAFYLTAAIGVLACIAIILALPKDTVHVRPKIADELRALIALPVLRALMTTSLVAGAMFTLYTYIAAVLQSVTHSSTEFVTAMLVLIGISFTIGNALGGSFADTALRKTLVIALLIMATTSTAFPLIGGSYLGAAVCLFVWGAATFGVIAPVQMQVMLEATEAPALASSVNIGAFNLGNAIGAAIGATVIDAGWGYAWIGPAGGVLALAALGLTLIPIRQSHSLRAG